MTVEEKRDRLNLYCNHIEGTFGLMSCNNHCLLTDEDHNCDFSSSEKDNMIELHYELIKSEIGEDMVNQPPHYKHGNMETIDEMVLIFGKEAVAHFCLCNAWKYRARALYKNKEEDMEKSHWYINKYKELTDGTESKTDI